MARTGQCPLQDVAEAYENGSMSVVGLFTAGGPNARACISCVCVCVCAEERVRSCNQEKQKTVARYFEFPSEELTQSQSKKDQEGMQGEEVKTSKSSPVNLPRVRGEGDWLRKPTGRVLLRQGGKLPGQLLAPCFVQGRGDRVRNPQG